MANWQTRYDVLPYGNFIYYSDTIPSTAAPSGLVFRQGDICYNTLPTAVGTAWWFCTAGGLGASSTWKSVQVDQTIANFRNLLDGGDFTVNPMQRNIAAFASGGYISTNVTNTLTYFADRWFTIGGSASSSVSQSYQTNTTIAGFNNSLRTQRVLNNANTAVIYTGQVLESSDCYRAQGLPVTISFWAAAGANFSPTSNQLTVQVIQSTAANQTAANMNSVSWTNQTNVLSQTVSLTSSMVRYQFTGTVLATTAQLGVQFSFTPTGTAGANDYFDLMGVQLEIGPQASNFEHRDVQVELEICQRYAWAVPEPAGSTSGGVMVGIGGTVAAANTQVFYMATPVQLRVAPNVSTATGSFSVYRSSSSIAAAALTIGATHTVNAITVQAGGTQALAQPAALIGGSGTGYILASADF